jgi:hypothetical protein
MQSILDEYVWIDDYIRRLFTVMDSNVPHALELQEEREAGRSSIIVDLDEEILT